jgi:hypothetical protein
VERGRTRVTAPVCPNAAVNTSGSAAAPGGSSSAATSLAAWLPAAVSRVVARVVKACPYSVAVPFDQAPGSVCARRYASTWVKVGAGYRDRIGWS